MLEAFEEKFRRKAQEICATTPDPSHDLLHLLRVVKTARKICAEEKARWEVVMPAAYFHDFVLIPKTDPRRAQASRISAEAALNYLRAEKYPAEYWDDIAHAIEAHSFSAGIPARSLEAQIVQDADRLDGIGAIGVARCFGLSGMIGRDFYSLDDPFARKREANDQTNSLDHFFVKLLKVPEKLHTASARAEGARRLAFMQEYLRQLETEL